MYASISSSTLDSEPTSTIGTQTNRVCKQAVKVVIKVVHQITYIIPELGFSKAWMSEDPKSQQRLLKLLQQQRWVITQEVDPTAGAIVITCKPEVMSKQMQATLEQLATPCKSAKNVEVAIEQPTTASLVRDEQPAKVDYSIAHAIPGRVRFHIPQIASDPQFVQRLETLLQADPTVKSERVNHNAASIVINYETQMLQDATPFPPQDYRLDSRGAGEQGSRGEKFASVILQREGSKKQVQNVFAAAVSHLISLIQSAGIAAKAC
ncbi:hypothetical protein JYQ62_37840 [Nostoc sp. UHCC 0702]|nr:hypothetical protein JYQ62_37840 [Nostoc sp. UHCC 0702]